MEKEIILIGFLVILGTAVAQNRLVGDCAKAAKLCLNMEIARYPWWIIAVAGVQFLYNNQAIFWLHIAIWCWVKMALTTDRGFVI